MSAYRLTLVTGAARRLGKAFALALARHGYAILLHYHHSEAEALATAEEIRSLGVPAFPVQADLTLREGIESVCRKIDALLSPEAADPISEFSLLVNSAAYMPRGDVESLTFENWDASLDLNLRAPFYLAQEAGRRMKNGGLIVNISDVGAQKSWSRYPSYTVSKSALETLTRLLARALAPSIRVNAIAPGFVMQSDIVSSEEWSRLIQRVPLRRPARIEEITSALEFLIENEYITGQSLVVDGGYSLLG